MTHRYLAGIDNTTASHLADRILANDLDLSIAGITRSLLLNADKATMQLIVKRRIDTFLSGRDARTAAAAMRRARRLGGSMSLVTARLLSHSGCDPAAWAILCPHVDFINLPGPMGGMTVVTDDVPGESALVDAHILLGEGTYWIGAGAIDLARAMPESMIAAMPGRPLHQIVSHTILDTFDLTVTACTEQSPGIYLVETDFEEKPEEENKIPFAHMTRRVVGRTARA